MSATLSWDKALGHRIQPGEVLAGKYRLERIIAIGGMGVIVQAHHLALDERVAIKFLTPEEGLKEESLIRFEREARASFKLQGEHACRVYDVGRHGDLPFMVMEYLEGQDLGHLLEDQIPHAVVDSVDFVLQATEAVAEAHAHGIVHRDLKPENLFLARRPDGSRSIKVLDFGLSKLHSAPEGRQRAVTRTQQIMGTPEYMSPEQWMSARDVGPATDQWSLGAILYELLTGRQPFREDNFAQLCARVLRGDIEAIGAFRSDVPAELEAAVRRAMSKDPEARFSHLGGFARAIAPYGHQQEATSSCRRIERLLNVTTELSMAGLAETPPTSPKEPAPDRGEWAHRDGAAPSFTEPLPNGGSGFDPRSTGDERPPQSGTHMRRRLADLKTTEVMNRDTLAAEVLQHRAAAATSSSGSMATPPEAQLSTRSASHLPRPDAPTIPLRRPSPPDGYAPASVHDLRSKLTLIVAVIVALGVLATVLAIASV